MNPLAGPFLLEPPWGIDVDTVLHNAGDGSLQEPAKACVYLHANCHTYSMRGKDKETDQCVGGMSHATSQESKRVAAAQQMQAHFGVTRHAALLPQRKFKRALRQLRPRRRLRIMRTRAAANEDEAGGGGVQHQTHGPADHFLAP